MSKWTVRDGRARRIPPGGRDVPRGGPAIPRRTKWTPPRIEISGLEIPDPKESDQE